uniref:Uncharacterized protein n=1 Tax=Chryseobacterium endophyticum TaxID=1854762 RepID=A0AAU6WM54_9FLAO
MLNTNLEQFVTIYGANLNFNPTNFSVEICSEKSTATNYTIIKTIDNSKVQLNNNGLSLIFYENFGSYPIGKYKIRLSNGQASYVSPVNFEVTDHLNSYDVSNLTWESRAIRNETVLDLQTDSRGAYSKAKFTGLQSSDWQSNNSPVVTVSSSPIANMAEDFLLEFTAYSDSEVYRDMLGGLTNENSPILGNNLFASIRFSNMSTVNNRMYVIKRGNIMTSIYKYNGGISANTEIVSVDSSVPVKLKICLGGTDMYDVRNNLLIKSAYKLN